MRRHPRKSAAVILLGGSAPSTDDGAGAFLFIGLAYAGCISFTRQDTLLRPILRAAMQLVSAMPIGVLSVMRVAFSEIQPSSILSFQNKLPGTPQYAESTRESHLRSWKEFFSKPLCARSELSARGTACGSRMPAHQGNHGGEARGACRKSDGSSVMGENAEEWGGGRRGNGQPPLLSSTLAIKPEYKTAKLCELK